MVTLLSDHKIGPAGLIAALLLAVPLYLLHHTLQQDEQHQNQARLEQRATLSFNSAQRSLSALQEQLQALRSLVQLSPELSRQQFDQFNSQTRISAYGIAAFEWIPRVERSEADHWVRQARADGVFDFRLSNTDSPQAALYPIYYTSAAQMNGLSLGTNLAAKPSLWQAMQQARTANSLHIGISENTEQDQTEGAEFRLILPVFSTDQQLRGFVSAMIRFEEAINILLGPILSSRNGLALEISDRSTRPAQPLFSSAPANRKPTLSAHFNQQLGDRQLTYQFSDLSPAPPWWQLPRSTLIICAIALVALTLLLLLQRNLARRARAEALAQQQTRSLKAVQSDYHNLLEKVIEGVYSATIEGRFIQVNPALARAFGYQSPTEMVQQVEQIGHQLHQNIERYRLFLSQLHQHKEVLNFEWQGQDCHGNSIWLSENAYLSHTEQGEPIYQGTIDVITERKQNEQQLSYQARHDTLTGLLNRTAFQQVLEHGLQQYRGGAVLFLDIDGFKKINDTLGHSVGDQFLRELAQRLSSCLHSNDTLARIGGDEFVIYSHGHDNQQDTIIQLAQRLQDTVCQPFQQQHQALQVSASIGITFIRPAYQHASDVLRDADLAMYEVKKNGKGNHQIFSLELHERMSKQNQLEQQLSTALANQEFSLHYQPVVGLRDQQVYGFEALLRWRNNQLGWVPPGRFIPLAEQSQLMPALGMWIIRQALPALARLQQETGRHELTMNINLSPHQLHDDQLLEQLPCLIKQHRLNPAQINFELTESALNIDESAIILRLEQLRQLGFGIYIDDFGTGYSSLKRLVNFPATGIKIDRSFVDRLDQDQNKRVMIEMIMSMAQLLELNVVAEGIETPIEHQILLQQGCHRAQGYLFYRPLPETTLLEQLCRTDHHDPIEELSLLPA